MADLVEKCARAFERATRGATRLTIRYFGLCLALVSYAGAAFLQDWIKPDNGDPTALSICSAVGTIIATAAALLLQFRDSGLIGELRSRNDGLKGALKGLAADVNEVWNATLAQWASELNFDGSDRISIYKHDGAGFMMLGRYSINTAYSAKGRVIYPAAQGCIGSAWTSGSGICFENAFPDHAVDPNGYVQMHITTWGLTDAEARGLVMKARAFYATTVTGRNGQRHAIVVFESMMPNHLKQRTLKNFMAQRGAEEVNDWMERMKNQLPSIALARGEGL